MKHKTNVCAPRRTARQVSLHLDCVAIGRPIRHLALVLEYDSLQEHMVLQVLANAGQVLDEVNSKTAECLRFSDAREHQKLRAMDGACGKDHFFVGCDIFYGSIYHYLDAHATSVFKVQFHHVGVEQQREVRPRQGWAQEGANGTHAGPIRGDVHVDVTGAGAHRSVHVIQNGHAHLSCSIDEGRRCWVRIFWTADVY